MNAKHKVLIVSNGFYETDGRLRELVEIAQLIGDTFLISRASEKVFSNHFVFNSKSNNYLSFLRFCYKVAIQIPDLTIVWADNRKALIPGQLIKQKLNNIKTICDSRELYIIKNVKHLVGKFGCVIERIFNKKYDVLICANQERAELMKKLYGLPKAPLVYENIRRLNYSPSAKIQEFQKKFKSYFSNDTIKIISTSGYSIERGGKKLIEDVGQLGEKYSLYIVGGGKKEEKIQYERLVVEKNLRNVFDIGRLNSDELKYFIQNCDIGVVFYHMDDFNNKYCASGKVYEFLFEGLPIVCSANPPLARFCNQYKVGIAGDSFFESFVKIIDNIDWYRENVQKTVTLIDIEQKRLNLANEIENRISNQ